MSYEEELRKLKEALEIAERAGELFRIYIKFHEEGLKLMTKVISELNENMKKMKAASEAILKVYGMALKASRKRFEEEVKEKPWEKIGVV